MDLNKLRELAGLPASATKSKKLNEHVVGNLSNGYDMQHSATKNYSDFFPTGNDYTADDEAGPASAKQGDNAMQKAIKIDKDELNESKEIHRSLVHAYRNFKKDIVKENRTTEVLALVSKFYDDEITHDELTAAVDKVNDKYPEQTRRELMTQYNNGKISYEELQQNLDKLNITDAQPDRSGEAYTDYSMRQGEMGNPDRNR